MVVEDLEVFNNESVRIVIGALGVNKVTLREQATGGNRRGADQ